MTGMGGGVDGGLRIGEFSRFGCFFWNVSVFVVGGLCVVLYLLFLKLV